MRTSCIQMSLCTDKMYTVWHWLINFCKFFILRKYLIPWFCYFASKGENIKLRTQFFLLYDFIYIKLKIVWKFKRDFKIHEDCFCQFYMYINSSHLMRNLQYLIDWLDWLIVNFLHIKIWPVIAMVVIKTPLICTIYAWHILIT